MNEGDEDLALNDHFKEKDIVIAEYTDDTNKRYLALSDQLIEHEKAGNIYDATTTLSMYQWSAKLFSKGFTFESKSKPGVFLRRVGPGSRLLEGGEMNENSIFELKANKERTIFKIQFKTECFTFHRQSTNIGFHLDDCNDNNKDQLLSINVIDPEKNKLPPITRLPPLDHYDPNNISPIDNIDEKPTNLPPNDLINNDNIGRFRPININDLIPGRNNQGNDSNHAINTLPNLLETTTSSKLNLTALPPVLTDLLSRLIDRINLGTSTSSRSVSQSTTFQISIFTTESRKPVTKTTKILKLIEFSTKTETKEVKITETTTSTITANTTKKSKPSVTITSSSVSCTTVPVIKTIRASDSKSGNSNKISSNKENNNSLCNNRLNDVFSLLDHENDSSSNSNNDAENEFSRNRNLLFSNALESISNMSENTEKEITNNGKSTSQNKDVDCNKTVDSGDNKEENDDVIEKEQNIIGSIADITKKIDELTKNEKIYELEGSKISDIFNFPKLQQRKKSISKECLPKVNRHVIKTERTLSLPCIRQFEGVNLVPPPVNIINQPTEFC